MARSFITGCVFLQNGRVDVAMARYPGPGLAYASLTYVWDDADGGHHAESPHDHSNVLLVSEEF